MKKGDGFEGLPVTPWSLIDATVQEKLRFCSSPSTVGTEPKRSAVALDLVVSATLRSPCAVVHFTAYLAMGETSAALLPPASKGAVHRTTWPLPLTFAGRAGPASVMLRQMGRQRQQRAAQ